MYYANGVKVSETELPRFDYRNHISPQMLSHKFVYRYGPFGSGFYSCVVCGLGVYIFKTDTPDDWRDGQSCEQVIMEKALK